MEKELVKLYDEYVDNLKPIDAITSVVGGGFIETKHYPKASLGGFMSYLRKKIASEQ